MKLILGLLLLASTHVLAQGVPPSFYSEPRFDAANVPITGGTIDGAVIGGTTPAAGTFTTVTAIPAATQDAVKLQGRSGGSSSFAATLTPTTLTASRTITLPDAATSLPIATQFLTFTGPTAARTITLPDANFTAARTNASNTLTDAQTITCAAGGCAGYNAIILNGTTTGGSRLTGSNTSGNFSVGVEDTTGGGMFGSTTASAAVFGTSVNKPVELASNNAVQVRISTNGVQIASSAANQLRTTQASVPTCTSNCGTSPAIVGSDSAGIVTMGSSGVPASGWVVTFNGTWGAAPSCVVQSALTTMVVGKMPIAVQTTTTTMTVTTNGTAPATSDKYAYHCIGIS